MKSSRWLDFIGAGAVPERPKGTDFSVPLVLDRMARKPWKRLDMGTVRSFEFVSGSAQWLSVLPDHGCGPSSAGGTGCHHAVS